MLAENSAHGAPRGNFAHSPTGFRRITLDMRARIDQADQFAGLPRGTAKPFQFLTAFQNAEPYLGLPPHTFKLLSWLVAWTEPQDWEEGSRPIAWPSARRQEEFLVLSKPRVKALNRLLQEAGLFVMRDNPQGRRYGHRDNNGRITEAYGFDLSPLAQRCAEFEKIAREAKAERELMTKLRRAKTRARKAIAQAVEELGIQGQDSDQLRQLVRETAELVTASRGCERSEELALAVKSLERRRSEAEEMLRQLIKPVETNPMGLVDDPHSTTTTLPVNHIDDTVIARRERSRGAEPPAPHDPLPSQPNGQYREELQVTPGQLVELAPRLAPFMPQRLNDYTAEAIVEAALWLSGEMGVNRTLWARACQVMGRYHAAAALAIVSTKPAEYFTSGPGGYFAGMLRKFEKGDLHLARTIWKLKDTTWGSDRPRRQRQPRST